MKIAFVLPSLANTGPVIVAHDLVKAMVKKNDITCVVFYLDEIKELEFDCETIHITRKQMTFEGFDIIHTHMLRPDMYTILQRKKYPHAKIISTLHNYMDKDLANLHGPFIAFFTVRIWCYLLNKFDKVVCLSNDMKTFYSKLIRPDKLTYIYNGRWLPEKNDGQTIPDADKVAIEQLKNSYRIIGGIGFLIKRKGFEQLVKVLAVNPAYALVIIGDGPEKLNLMKLAEDLQVSDRCFFPGYRANARDYFPVFDIYAMTSHSEGFPLVLLEAASFGLAAICSDLPIFKEVFNDEEVGYYRLSDISDLSLQLDAVWEAREMLSVNIYRKFNKCYTAEVMADNYIKLYKQLLNVD